MKRLLFSAVPAAAAAFLLASCATTAPPADAPAAKLVPEKAAPTAKKPPVDLEQLAQKLVTQSAGVKEGDIVLISGGAHDVELLENIAVNVRKAGAFPLIDIGSDRLTKRMFTDVPEKYDSQLNELGMKLAEIADVTINVDSNLTEGLLADVDPKRLAARAKAGAPIGEAFRKRNVRSVDVGNGFYPTAWRAARYGMPEDELVKTFWEGVNVDYTSLQARGEQVKATLGAGNELHVTDPNGTDLKVRVQGRPVFVSDGIISEEDAKKGGAAVSVFLPAGEVYVTPVPGTAEGKVVLPKDYFQGKEVRNLTMTFAGGKLTGLSGEGEGFAAMKAQYDASAEGKDLFAVVDLGINPNIKLPAGSAVGNWVPAGTITVGIGNNTWAGGDNNSPFGYFPSLTRATVLLDGKAIIEAGQLKI